MTQHKVEKVEKEKTPAQKFSRLQKIKRLLSELQIEHDQLAEELKASL